MANTEGQRMLARNMWLWREKRRISASELAEQLDWPLVAVEAIERAEKADVTLDDIDRLAIALQIEPYDLFRRNTQ